MQEGAYASTSVGALAAVVLAISAAPSFAENRVALVIGNGAYEHAPHLPNPANDAADVSAVLKRSGFETILATDLKKAGMDEVTIRFAPAARVASTTRRAKHLRFSRNAVSSPLRKNIPICEIRKL